MLSMHFILKYHKLGVFYEGNWSSRPQSVTYDTFELRWKVIELGDRQKALFFSNRQVHMYTNKNASKMFAMTSALSWFTVIYYNKSRTQDLKADIWISFSWVICNWFDWLFILTLTFVYASEPTRNILITSIKMIKPPLPALCWMVEKSVIETEHKISVWNFKINTTIRFM